MKTPQLPQLPSVQELLDHPRVKGLVERINRSTLAQRAGQFLDDLRESVSQRAERLEIPSVGQLAERFARRVFGDPPPGTAWINATGVVVGAAGLAPPLPDAALQALMQAGGDFGLDEHAARQRATDALARRCPGHSAVIVGSLDAAVLLCCSAVATGRRVGVVHSGNVASAETGFDWPQLGARAGVVFSDLRGSPSGEHAAVMRAFQSEVGDWPEGRAVRIEFAPLAGLLNPQEISLPAVATIPERLASGADLVIVDGAGLLAGPACGIVVGRAEQLALVATHPLVDVLQASGIVCSLLAASVAHDHREDADAERLALPIWQLLSAPVENLRQRAGRLSQLLAEPAAVQAAEVVECESLWASCGELSLAGPTAGIALAPAGRSAEQLAEALRQAPRPIASRIEGDRVVLDLRSVFPRWDQELVAAVENLA